MAADALGNAYLAGYTNSTNFPTRNPIQGSLSGSGTYDGWVSKVSPKPPAPVFTAISPVTGSSSTDQDTNSQMSTPCSTPRPPTARRCGCGPTTPRRCATWGWR